MQDCILRKAPSGWTLFPAAPANFEADSNNLLSNEMADIFNLIVELVLRQHRLGSSGRQPPIEIDPGHTTFILLDVFQLVG